jgi:sarcosine oxidase subunit gamma
MEDGCVSDLLSVTERSDLSFATILARRGVAAAEIGAALDIAAPEAPRYVAGNGLALVGAGPGSWLAIGDGGDPGWPNRLADSLAGLAAVTDQSGSYRLLRISGCEARILLQRGAFIDLDPRAFGQGDAATTVIAQIGVVFWQIDAGPTYEIALFRSYAESFRHWLVTTASQLPSPVSVIW